MNSVGAAVTTKNSFEKQLIVVLTLDGQLHALNPTAFDGRLLQPLWSQQVHGALIQGATTQRHLQPPPPPNPENDSHALTPIEPIFLIEPVGNGTVFAYLPGEALQKLPLTMKQLVEQSPGRLADGTLYLGSRSSSFLDLNLDSNGQLIKPEDAQDATAKVLVGKSFLHLQILKPNGTPRWNATLTNVEGVRSTTANSTTTRFYPYVTYHSSFNGYLIARSSRTHRIKWAAHFGFPVVGLFHLVPLADSPAQVVYSLRSLPLEMKNAFAAAAHSAQNDLVNIGEIDGALFVLPQSRFPIIEQSRLFQQQPNYASEEGEEVVDDIIVYQPPPPQQQQLVDDFDPTECFPGMPGFPECLKGSKVAYKPFPVPLIEGATYASGAKQTLLYVSSIALGALLMLIFLKRRRPLTATGSASQSALKVFEEDVLGYGSHGTVVFRGEFDGRPVAVKRMLLDFYDVAGQEVSLLQHSDHHPNVIRYYYRQHTEKFVMIALELCPQTLQSLVENDLQEERVDVGPPGLSETSSIGTFSSISATSLTRSECCDRKKEIMRQIIAGLEHLHKLNIVHRDIKPGNILITSSGRVVLSDFGVSKKLAADQMSFQATVATGTMGWRAPEVILSDEATHHHAQNSSSSSTTQELNVRVTKAIDIFAAGCVFYYVQSGGGHVFGERLLRDSNIIAGKYDLGGLGEDSEALLLKDLICKMIDRKAERRPTAAAVLNHAYFWEDAKRLAFLEAVSDRLERDDRTLGITNRALEAEKHSVFTQGPNVSWHTLVDRSIWDSTEHRKYFGNSLQDLLRLVRNKRHHWQELPPEGKRLLGDPMGGYLRYFLTLFPNLLAYTWKVIAGSPYILEQPFCSEYY